jgi:hypothetical protein
MMKKWIILGGAVLTALLLLVFCSDDGFKFDNPLDEKGTQFLFGDTSKREEKITVTNGTSGLFDSTKTWCDGTPPGFRLIGPEAVTISTIDIEDFLKWVGARQSDPWKDVVEVTGNQQTPSVISARLLSGNGTEIQKDKMPAPADNYKIVYEAKKPDCLGEPVRSTVERTLVVEENVLPDTGAPRIILADNIPNVDKFIGDTYTDGGVNAFEWKDGTPITTLSKIEIKDKNGSVIQTIPGGPTAQAIAALSAAMTNWVAREDETTYTIVYTVTSRNNRSSSVQRTVAVTRRSDSDKPEPVIVLSKYRHVIEGHTIMHKDTAFMIGGTYVEKGIDTVYYIKDGRQIGINRSLVTLGPAPSTNVSSPNSTRNRKYTLPGTGEYQGTEETRYVRIFWDRDGCMSPGAGGPVITFNGGSGDALEISGNTWNASNSWSVAAGDGDNELSGGYPLKYIVDFGGLDPNNLVVRPAPYTVKYVALSGCGVYTVRVRTVTVK